MKRSLLAGVSGLALTALASCQPSDSRPNFLIIITDDQRHDTMEYMPRTQARIFDEGITFARGYVTTPNCGPSRASVLTGMYAHNHGVHVDKDPFQEETFVADLHEAGYFTGIAGKYLNSWARDDKDELPRPEFDFWVVFGSQEGLGDYFAPELNVSGTWVVHEGYFTYILRDYALDFLAEAELQQKPFLLIFAPYAPHEPADPPPGDEDLYPDLPPHRPPSFNEADVSDKPLWLREGRSLLGSEEIEDIDSVRRKQLQSLNAVDEAVESLLLELEKQGKLDNTVVIYLSDNGQYWGEHRLEGKRKLYEETIRVPFALRYPALVQGPRVEDGLVANIDIAPTVYELAGLPIPPGIDGRSLVPLLEGTDDWREDLIIEVWSGEDYSAQGIHTDRYVYIRTEGDWITELYDLMNDPYQLENRADDPEYAEIEADLESRLDVARPGFESKPASSPVSE